MTEIFVEQSESMREHGILLICIKAFFCFKLELFV